MSEPKNPLLDFHSYSYKHILVAFQYSLDADTYTIGKNVGPEGEVISGGCGPGVVVVNEFEGKRFYIRDAEWEHSFYSPCSPMISSNVGLIEIEEKIGMSFMDFMINDVVPKLGDVSISHIAFALRTFFICSNHNGENKEIIVGNPYIFNASHIVVGTNDNSPRPNSHTMMTMGISTTTAQMPSYSNLYQMTLTHKDGNLHNKSTTT